MATSNPELVSFLAEPRIFIASALAGHTILKSSHIGGFVKYDIGPEGDTTVYAGREPTYLVSRVYPGNNLQGVWRRQGSPKRKLIQDIDPADIRRGDRLSLVTATNATMKSPRITGTISIPLDDDVRERYAFKAKAAFNRYKIAEKVAAAEVVVGIGVEAFTGVPTGSAFVGGMLGAISTLVYALHENGSAIYNMERYDSLPTAEQAVAAAMEQA